MIQNHNLANHLLGVAWNKFVTYTTYKVGNTSRCVILVDPNNTSKKCSNCDILVDKDLS